MVPPEKHGSAEGDPLAIPKALVFVTASVTVTAWAFIFNIPNYPVLFLCQISLALFLAYRTISSLAPRNDWTGPLDVLFYQERRRSHILLISGTFSAIGLVQELLASIYLFYIDWPRSNDDDTYISELEIQSWRIGTLCSSVVSIGTTVWLLTTVVQAFKRTWDYLLH